MTGFTFLETVIPTLQLNMEIGIKKLAIGEEALNKALAHDLLRKVS